MISLGLDRQRVNEMTSNPRSLLPKPMNWIDRPDSSVISRFCYDSERRVLVIEFKHGGIYDYYDVPESVFEEMSNASSAGRYYNANVKDVYRVTGPR